MHPSYTRTIPRIKFILAVSTGVVHARPFGLSEDSIDKLRQVALNATEAGVGSFGTEDDGLGACACPATLAGLIVDGTLLPGVAEFAREYDKMIESMFPEPVFNLVIE